MLLRSKLSHVSRKSALLGKSRSFADLHAFLGVNGKLFQVFTTVILRQIVSIEFELMSQKDILVNAKKVKKSILSKIILF